MDQVREGILRSLARRYGGRSCRRHWCWRRLAAAYHSFAAFCTQTITIALDRDHLTVMEQPIEDRGRHDVIAQGPTPVCEPLIRREQNAATFVTSRHQLEQQMGGLWRHREVAKFVDLC